MPKAKRSRLPPPSSSNPSILVDTMKKVRKTRKSIPTPKTVKDRQDHESVERQKVGLPDMRPQTIVERGNVGELYMEEQQLQAVPFGFGFKGLILGDGIPDGTQFPVTSRSDARRIAKEVSRYALKACEKPFLIGPAKDPLYDGTRWTQGINDHIRAYSDALPLLPMLLLLIGPLGGGKTTIITSLLEAFAHPNAFKKIRIASASMGMDPSILNCIYNRHPEVEYIISEKPDLATMKAVSEKVRKAYEPLMAMAKKGKYKLAPEKRLASAADYLIDVDNPRHPGLQDDGALHGNEIYFPDVRVKETPINALKDIMSLPSYPKGFQGDCSMPMRAFDYSNVKQPYHDNIQAEVYRLLSTNPDLRTSLNEEHRFGLKVNEDNPLVNQIDPTLWIFDDCAFQLLQQGIQQQITILRHMCSGLIAAAQKLSSLPTMARTNATGIIILNIADEKEMQFFEDEYGYMCNNNFRGLYESATQPFGERTHDFLYINLRERKAYRSFSGELVAVI